MSANQLVLAFDPAAATDAELRDEIFTEVIEAFVILALEAEGGAQHYVAGLRGCRLAAVHELIRRWETQP